jgi:protein-disulfide isomerase
MTRRLTLFGSAAALVLAAAACSKPEVSEGNAAAQAPANTPANQSVDTRVSVADTNRIMGNPDAKVWLVMASDFQCPACKTWHDRYSEEIMRDYVQAGKIRFAYTNFPLDHIHPHARAAAEAALCAAAQGKFWGMHDRLFATQNEWSPTVDPTPIFQRLASESGADVAAWNQCLADDVMVPMVDGDRARGVSGGANQTPYFFVGSRRVGGAIPPRILRPLLDSALAEISRVTR